ncbi:cathepsin B [Leptinotarsa decemlineata]|uniref:cathepsin B n=1 Tax=Leptinotarsa decemlineata TaxID=7539 RepID=UPI003D30AE00
MKLSVFILFILATYAEDIPDPLSDEFIEHINKLNLSWKAGRNFHKSVKFSDVKRLLGVLPGKPSIQLKTVYPSKVDKNTTVPVSFDSRKKWSNCESIRTIRDQANCGACWAFASVEAMSDRLCIASNQTKQISVSAEDLLACCGMKCGKGCNGGFIAQAWMYWNTDGIVTGGNYERYDGCVAYSIAPCEHNKTGIYKNCTYIAETPQCKRQCDDITLNYTSQKTYGHKPYTIIGYEKDIQLEIMTNGPVAATLEVYSDLFSYKSGVYRKSNYSKFVGLHAGKIIGWGVEKNVSYWLIANSWNEDWGTNGFFKIVRGEDHCGIESTVVAGLPDFRNNNTDSGNGSFAPDPTSSVFLIILLTIQFLFYSLTM